MIFDIETDGLELDKVTVIHCMAYKLSGSPDIKATTDYNEMRKLLLSAKELVGHNIIFYDIPVLEKILNIKIRAKIVDTLAVSWYAYPKRLSHGLEKYGQEFGVPKPEITDWENLPIEEYVFRCQEDVKITQCLWTRLKEKLLAIYGNKAACKRLVSYLSFKLKVVQSQRVSKWLLDKNLAQTTLDELTTAQDEKICQLIPHMPKVPVYAVKQRPAKPYKKDGGLSAKGMEWDRFLKSRGLSSDHREPVKYLVREDPPNPNSPEQVKAWLLTLGWVPETFKYVKEGDSERAIPQIRVDGDGGKELCPSVLKLVEQHPFLELLEGLTVIQHRIGILEGFLSEEKNGYLVATMHGFTNTLRLKHRGIVNLPGIHKPFGKQIRGCLVAKKGNILCGSDMSSLEENTKKHYMFPYDPEYVEAMSSPDFDAHLDLARFAKRVTDDDIKFYVSFKKLSKQQDFQPTEKDKERWKIIDVIRKLFKAANYACIYGVGAAKLARTTGLSLAEAKKLIEVYWQRNWSVREFSENAEIKTVDGEMWVYNPVSGFYYSLRNKKDVFSTLNQSTGVYCFDTWIKEIYKVDPQFTAQFHDEIVKELLESLQESCKKVLLDAIDATNKKLNLNVTLGVDIQFGYSYADIH